QLLSSGWKRDDRFRPDLLTQCRLFRVFSKMSVVVIGYVELVDDLNSPQILSLINSLETGNDQPQREALLRTHWLAIHAVAHQTIVHRLADRNARRCFFFLRPFRDDPRRFAFDASLLEQQRERNSSPFAATSQPVRFLNCLIRGFRTVSDALEKMN